MKFDPNRRPLIYLITDGAATAQNYCERSSEILTLVNHAVRSKIPLVQLREKQLSAKLLFDLAKRAADLVKNSETKLLVNDRADIALTAGADGVHLTAGSIPAGTVRRAFPRDFIIGVSAHTLAEAQKSKQDGADFAVFGPVFATPGKGKPLGLSVLQQVCARLAPFPILALGGIDETNYREVLKISAGLAAIRFLNNKENLRKIMG